MSESSLTIEAGEWMIENDFIAWTGSYQFPKSSVHRPCGTLVAGGEGRLEFLVTHMTCCPAKIVEKLVQHVVNGAHVGLIG